MEIKLKKQILSNTFTDQVLGSMTFDDSAYKKLCSSLKLLASELKGCNKIDRELMLSLYSIPTIVRNMFLSFSGVEDAPDIALKLEDAWVELDALVMECLSE